MFEGTSNAPFPSRQNVDCRNRAEAGKMPLNCNCTISVFRASSRLGTDPSWKAASACEARHAALLARVHNQAGSCTSNQLAEMSSTDHPSPRAGKRQSTTRGTDSSSCKNLLGLKQGIASRPLSHHKLRDRQRSERTASINHEAADAIRLRAPPAAA